MFTLAHLSDPHISPLPPVRTADLIGKRLVGFTNWRLRRSVRHDPAAMAAIERDIKATSPDHIAVLGDLVNICLPAEFPRAAAFLARLGSPHDVTVVPGNHDAYVRAHARTFLSAWRGNLTGDTPSANGEPFPFVRRRGPAAFICLSSAVPTLPFLATGTIGRRQLERLSALLRDIKRDGLFRVVLIHHPPAGKRAPHKVLTDASAFREVIASHGAELILHGHDHRRSLLSIPGPRGDVPLVGVPSASAPGSDELPGGWNLYRIDGATGAWRCEVEMRELASDGSVSAVATHRLI
jgi:3',5'-cyclic AMP phosphodiesterase CpdA